MAAVIFYSARCVLRRNPEIGSPRRSLAAGVLALALSVAAELGLAVVLQSQTLAEFIQSKAETMCRARRTPSSCPYLQSCQGFACQAMRWQGAGAAMPDPGAGLPAFAR